MELADDLAVDDTPSRRQIRRRVRKIEDALGDDGPKTRLQQAAGFGAEGVGVILTLPL